MEAYKPPNVKGFTSSLEISQQAWANFLQAISIDTGAGVRRSHDMSPSEKALALKEGLEKDRPSWQGYFLSASDAQRTL